MNIFVDTNLFLRFLTQDHQEHAGKARDFISNSINSSDTGLVTSDYVISELVYTLRSYYEVSISKSGEQVSTILEFCKLIRPGVDFYWQDVFSIEVRYNVNFIDAANYLIILDNDVDRVATFDSDFDRFDDLVNVMS